MGAVGMGFEQRCERLVAAGAKRVLAIWFTMFMFMRMLQAATYCEHIRTFDHQFLWNDSLP